MPFWGNCYAFQNMSCLTQIWTFKINPSTLRVKLLNITENPDEI